MDTRNKIVPAAEALRRIGEWRQAGKRVRVIKGTFDPLLADHVRGLDKADDGEKLVVLLGDGGEPILPRQARGELVAGLRVVDLVIVDDLDELSGVEDLVAGDESRARGFVAHVRNRNRAGS